MRIGSVVAIGGGVDKVEPVHGHGCCEKNKAVSP